MGLRALFLPRAVAVVGSAAEGKLGHFLIERLRQGGFTEVYAVNPKAQGVGEVPGYPAVVDIPVEVDMAVVAAPAPTVKGVLEDCGRAGVKAAVIITSGFAEAGNSAGEEEIKKVARDFGIRYTGPNCAGLINTHHRLFATLEVTPPKGATALVSQSGALGSVIMSLGAEQGLGFSKFVSYGNGSDLNETELLDYLKDDPDTEVGALYIESVSDGRRFMETVREFTRRKPLVVIKSGRTQTGQRAALSHTGSMAGADTVYDAALRECGAIRVESAEELVDLCKGFSYRGMGLPPVKRRRVIIVTNSGGPGVMAADKAEEVGLDVAEPSPGLVGAMRGFLPPHAGFRNPVDLTVEGTEDGYRQVLLEALKEYDAALALYVGTPYLDALPIARGIAAAAREAKKPVVAHLTVGRNIPAALSLLEEAGIPNFPCGERGAKVLAHMATYYAHHARTAYARVASTDGARRSGDEVATAAGAQVGAVQAIRHLPGEGPILEPDGMALLREHGIPVPEYRFATGKGEAISACRQIGYPVVMKVVSPQILHKSDHGGVVLNIDGDGAAAAAYESIERAASGRDFRGVITYPMLRGGREALLGMARDAQFGPVVVFGLGGIYTEVLKDVALRIAPVDIATAEDMIRSIKAYPILRGVRGQEPADLEALAEVIVKFSHLPFLYPEIEEIDLNPVFVFPKGTKGALVGDVRLVRRDQK